MSIPHVRITGVYLSPNPLLPNSNINQSYTSVHIGFHTSSPNTHPSNYDMYTGVVTMSSHALWRVHSNKIMLVLGHCWVDTPHIYTFEADSLIFQSCLLSTVTVTPSDSDYVNRSASLIRFRLEFTTTRADKDESSHSYRLGQSLGS